MLRCWSRWLLPLAFAASVALGLCLFQSRPPRDQNDLAALETLVQEARSAYPNAAVKAIAVHGLSADYKSWIRYFAAPGRWYLSDNPHPDTVFTLIARDAPTPPPDSFFWQGHQAAFRAYLSAP